MVDSENYFDITIPKERLEVYLMQISSGFNESQCVRVLRDQAGQLSPETMPFGLPEGNESLKVYLGRQ